jgi:hypothetical protein
MTMDRTQSRTEVSRRDRLAADVAARIEELFKRLPALRGFSVQPGARLTRDRSAGHLVSDLYLSDLVFFPAQPEEQAAAQRDEISAELLELVDEEPEAAPMLRGRTFARSLQ